MRARQQGRTANDQQTQRLTRSGELLLKRLRGLVLELVRLERNAKLHAVLVHERSIRLIGRKLETPALTGPPIVDVPALAGFRLEDEGPVHAALRPGGAAAVTGETRATILSCRLIEDAPEHFSIGRELEILKTALRSPIGASLSMRHSKDDDADTSMLGTGEEEIGGERIDVSVRNHDEQWKVASERVLGALRGISEYGLELRELDQHSEEGTGHGLWRQDQHFPAVRA
jgi:hypothetical protein